MWKQFYNDYINLALNDPFRARIWEELVIKCIAHCKKWAGINHIYLCGRVAQHAIIWFIKPSTSSSAKLQSLLPMSLYCPSFLKPLLFSLPLFSLALLLFSQYYMVKVRVLIDMFLFGEMELYYHVTRVLKW